MPIQWPREKRKQARQAMGDNQGISLDKLSKVFGETTAIDSVSMHVPEASLTVLLGPSGCGKSTLLRLVSGLETPSSGHIEIGGARVEHQPASARNLSMVF